MTASKRDDLRGHRAPPPLAQSLSPLLIPLLALLTAIGWYVAARVSIAREVAAHDDRAVRVASKLLSARLELTKTRLAEESELLSEDIHIKAALGANRRLDAATYVDILNDLHRPLELDLLAVLAPDAAVLGVTGAPNLSGVELGASSLVRQVQSSTRAGTAVWGLDGTLYTVGLTAIRDKGQVVGMLLVGSALRETSLLSIQQLSGTGGAVAIGSRILSLSLPERRADFEKAMATLPVGRSVSLLLNAGLTLARVEELADSALPAKVIWLRPEGADRAGLEGLEWLLWIPMLGATLLGVQRRLARRPRRPMPELRWPGGAAKGFLRCALMLAAMTASSVAHAAENPCLSPASGEPVGSIPCVESPPPPAQSSPETRTATVPLSDSERIARLEDQVDALQHQVNEKGRLTITGYVDFGFFVPEGDGSGVIQDVGNVVRPDLAGQYGWVFLGDLLSTAVNSRGESADLGSLPGVHRFDSVHSGGAPGFIVNEVNLTLNYVLSGDAQLRTSADFVPRSGSDFSLGDFFDLDLAQLEWQLTSDHLITAFAGKIEPAFGIEYKDRKANRRFGITPSLIARYTTGTPLGLKLRARLLDDWLVLAGSVTNGSSGQEAFHFYDEIDSNSGKTVTGRAALNLPLKRLGPEGWFAGALSVGLSGEYGPQDHARDSDGALWLIGLDLEYSGVQLLLKGQWMRGFSPGRAADGVYALALHGGGYLEVDWMPIAKIPELGLLGRAEFRDAQVSLGNERTYISKVWRVTAGARLMLTPWMTIKLEYLKNGESGEVPNLANDVFTSSLVMSYGPFLPVY